MRSARRWGAPAALAASSLMLVSCGMVDAFGDADAGEQSATVGVLIPRSGWQEDDGEGVLASVQLAISETANDIGGWTVNVVPVPEDDGVDIAMTELADADLVAVIGGLSTEAVRAAQPVLNEASVLFVSPADVDPVHTRGADPAAPLRPYRSYFRTSVTDEPPAAALARYAVSGLDAHAVAVVNGGDPAEARAFSRALRDAGGEVVSSGVADDVAGVAGLIQHAKAAEAQAVFVTGSADIAVAVAEETRRLGLDAEVLGTAALRKGEFVEAAGSSAEGAVTAVPPQLQPTEGAEPEGLAAELDVAGAAELGSYGAAAYDAATAVGTVLTRCLPPASSAATARRGCAGEMLQVDFAGVTGEVAFDEFGDRVGGVSEIRVLRDGEWVPAAST